MRSKRLKWGRSQLKVRKGKERIQNDLESLVILRSNNGVGITVLGVDGGGLGLKVLDIHLQVVGDGRSHLVDHLGKEEDKREGLREMGKIRGGKGVGGHTEMMCSSMGISRTVFALCVGGRA